MRNNGRPNGKIVWICAVRKRELNRQAQARYALTAGGRATARRYETSPAGYLTKYLRGMARIRFY